MRKALITSVLAAIFVLVILAFPKKTEEIRPVETLAYVPRAQQAPEVFLPGAIDLQSVAPRVLGAEAEVDPLEVLRIVNEERAKVDSPALAYHQLLAQAAQMRAETILRHENFSHLDPYENIQLDTVLPRVGYHFSYASENIGLAQSNARGFVGGFMSSPPHRQNLLDANLRETGVGVTGGQFGPNLVTIVVQIFAVPTSRTAYFGYDNEDTRQVAELLAQVNLHLGRSQTFLSQATTSRDREYYSSWEEILRRQKQILETVLTRMRQGQAYDQVHYELIAEYNQNWTKTPEAQRR